MNLEVKTLTLDEYLGEPGKVEPTRPVRRSSADRDDERESRLLGSLCAQMQARLDESKDRATTWVELENEYNSGRLVPELLTLRGPSCGRTLRGWLSQYEQADFDSQTLLHGNKSLLRGRKVTGGEQAVLLNMLLTPRRVKIGSAITRLKQMAG